MSNNESNSKKEEKLSEEIAKKVKHISEKLQPKKSIETIIKSSTATLKSKRFRKLAIQVLTILIAIIIISPLISFTVPTRYYNVPELSIYNTTWNGCSKLKNSVEENGYSVSVIITTTVIMKRFNYEGVLVIIGPRSEYSSDEIEEISNFVSHGGGLLLVDDFGSGNSIADYFGFHFSKEKLIDYGSYDRSPYLPVIVDFANHSITRNVSAIIMNKPTALSISADVETIAYSSNKSWLDFDNDEKWDVDNETRGPLPVIQARTYGQGKIVVISDPSMFNNDMIDRRDNLVLFINIINWLMPTNASTVIFDESHFGWEDVVMGQGIISRLIGPMQFISFDQPFSYTIILLTLPTIALITARYTQRPHKLTHKKEKKRIFYSPFELKVDETATKIKANPRMVYDEINERLFNVLHKLGLDYIPTNIGALDVNSFITLIKKVHLLLPEVDLFQLEKNLDLAFRVLMGGEKINLNNALMNYLYLRDFVILAEKRLGGG